MNALTSAPPRIGTWLMLLHGEGVLAKLARAGLDFVRLDLEHTPVDAADVARLAREARELPIDVCLRTASSRPEDIARALSMGVDRLYVPQIETASDARELVASVRAHATRRVHVSVMLESVEAFRNCDAIGEVDGIDMLSMGPADLAQDLGIYSAPDEDSRIDPYRYQLRDAALRCGKTWELGVWTLAAARRWAEEGCPVLTFMTDTSALRAGYTAALAAFAALPVRQEEPL